ncbi:hypothetical protein PAI11_37530 [Patulibacter medicamentivorans]|uniref:Uncharacterized protein n=1 Tax=Patulibacter medicamentivorans TaxID=1097667 RepID=H0EA79_9ACTN|nr:hypothetical protein [Patulibacter medicamentivorans]EHN09419.1 hypothetical protein PAI11_37530 [Patulibacter medicamentivorans]
MSVELDIDEDGLAELAHAVEVLSQRASDLAPMGWRLRRRWVEAERRLFEVRPWPARAASTLARYRYRVRHSADEQLHHVEGGVMHFTGLLERSLTTEHALGTMDRTGAVSSSHVVKKKDGTSETRTRPGGLDLTVGLRANGPLFHGVMNEEGAGSRPKREVVVFDEIAHQDAAGDVVDYLIENFGSDT